MDPETFKKLEEERGLIQRSTFINKVLNEHFKEKERSAEDKIMDKIIECGRWVKQ